MKKNLITVTMKPSLDAPEDAEPVVVEVLCMLGDQMRAELEVKKRGLAPTTHGIAFVGAMAWAAMARQGLTAATYDEFGTLCYDARPVDPDNADPVDPTQQAASSGSASPSPSPSTTPPNGGSNE